MDRDWEDFKTKFNAKSQIDLNQYKPARCSGGLQT